MALGVAMSLVALVVIVFVRDPTQRPRALGFVFVGFSIVAVSGAVFLLSRLSNGLPIVAGLPPIALLVAVAVGLRLAASREFRRYRSEMSAGDPVRQTTDPGSDPR